MKKLSMKKSLSVFLAAIMTLTAMAGMLTFSAGAEGSATAADVSIGTPEELKAFFTRTDTYEGKTIVLTADIDMKDIGRFDGGAAAFAGTFDGQGHTIKNMTVNNSANNGVGLFGSVAADKTATIKNLVILSSTYRTYKWQTGFVGNVSGTLNIDNVYSELAIGTDWVPSGDVGGFVGCMQADAAVVNITDSVYAGNITNKSGGNHGGFIGTINKGTANITNCGYYGNIVGEADVRNSGFVSRVKGTANINKCVFGGTINRSDNKAAYFVSDPSSGTYTLSGNLYVAQKGIGAFTETGATAIALKSSLIGDNAQTLIDTNSLTGWSKANGYMLPAKLATMLGTSFNGVGTPPLSATHWYTIETNDETPTLLIIDSAEDLIAFSEALNEAELTFEGLTVELGADVTLNDGWSIADGTPNNVWKLTNGNCVFSGILDGKGHTVSGIYQKSANAGIGILGTAKNATVKNLTVLNSYVESDNYNHGGIFGTVAGENTLEKLYVDIDLVNNYSGTNAQGDMGVGGLVGSVPANAYLTASNCVFAGTVKTTKDLAAAGIRGVGGFVGAVNGSDADKNAVTLTDCGFFGAIETKRNVAGGMIGAIGNLEDAPKVAITNSVVGGTLYTEDLEWNGSMCGYMMSGTLTTSNCYYIKLNDAGVMVNRPVYGALEGFETWDGCTLMSDLDLRGTDASAVLTEKKLANWSATAGYVMPTALNAQLPATLPGEGDVANDVLVPKDDGKTDDTKKDDTPADTEPVAPAETKADDTDADTETEEKKKGCGSVIGAGAFVLASVIGAALAVGAKKKED